MDTPIQVKVNFSHEAYAELASLAKRRGKEMVDIISDALALEEYLDGEHQKGTLVLVDKDGSKRELVRQ